MTDKPYLLDVWESLHKAFPDLANKDPGTQIRCAMEAIPWIMENCDVDTDEGSCAPSREDAEYIIVSFFSYALLAMHVDAPFPGNLMEMIHHIIKKTSQETVAEHKRKQRKSFSAESVRQYVEVLQKHYDGKCPICWDTIIVVDGQRVGGNIDHIKSNSRNEVANGWLICHACHTPLQKSENRDRVEDDAKLFHHLRSKMFDGKQKDWVN